MRKLTFLVAMLAALSAAPAFAQFASEDYRIERLTIAGVTGAAASSSYAMDVTAAQEGPVGAASRCNDSFRQTFGFWSVLGHAVVPVVLTIGRDAVDRTRPELVWTGSSSEFTLYRAAFRDGVADPVNSILVTTACSTVDAPPAASILYYVVQPTGN